MPARVRASASRPRSPVWCPSPAFPLPCPAGSRLKVRPPLRVSHPGLYGEGKALSPGRTGRSCPCAMQRSAVPSGLRCRRRANPAAAPCSAAQCPPSCAAGHRPKLLPCGEVQRSAVPSELRCRHRTKPNAGWLTTVHHSSVCTADSTLTTLSCGAAQRSILWAALPAPARAAPWCVDPPRVVSPYAGTDTWDGAAPPDAVRVCRGMETIHDNHHVGSSPRGIR